MTDLFKTQPSRPAYLESVDMVELTPFQRALMTIDGTVTKFIEAYQLETIKVTCLSQAVSPIGDEYKWLDIEKQSLVTVREVLLQGDESKTMYAYAVTFIVTDGLGNSVEEGLNTDGASIGRLLIDNKMETYRQVLWDGKRVMHNLPEAIANLNGTEFLSRTYRIIHQGKPIMMITENFPLS